jgi:threonine/homoserine/homoserine lactone efflux protein
LIARFGYNTDSETIMDLFLLVISAFILGFIAAVPVGPVQIEVMRRSLNGHLKSSLVVILGAFLSDFVYGSIAFFGIAPYLEEKMVMAVFWLGGAAILIVLGIMSIRNGLHPRAFNHQSVLLKKKRWAFLGGLSLAGANPMLILWWLLAARIFRDVGLIHEFTHEVAVSFLIAGCMGLAAYLTTLSLFLYWAKRFISEKRIGHINIWFGVALLLIAGYFLYSSVGYFLGAG